jgi:hypothetical protein
MKPKKRSKLVLNRETIRNLNKEEARDVAGGTGPPPPPPFPSFGCPPAPSVGCPVPAPCDNLSYGRNSRRIFEE